MFSKLFHGYLPILSLLSVLAIRPTFAYQEYDYRELIKMNPTVTGDFKFLAQKNYKTKIKIAVIGDYIYPDTFSSIAYNTAEIPNNDIDDDGNGYIDDYQGMNITEMNGQLDSIVTTNHENGIVALLDSLITHYGQTDTFSIIPINVNTQIGHFDDLFIKKVADAIDYARIRGAKVVNMSIGFSAWYESFFQFIDNDYERSFAYVKEAIDRAHAAGMILVATASNDPTRDHVREGQYPATLKNIVSVANVTSSGSVKSGYGQNIEVGYLGTGIGVWNDPYVGNEYVTGSSFAAPLVSLAIAAAAAQEPQLRYSEELLEKMRNSCKRSISGSRNIKSKCVMAPDFL